MTPQEREQRLTTVMGLTLSCPHDDGNPAFCPLCEVRKLPPSGRIAFVRGLSDEDLEYLGTYHQICLQCRESFL